MQNTNNNNTATILIVEDEYSLRELCKNFLEEQGFKVFTAPDGLKGLEILKNQHVDLVVCDISMPNMDGIGLLNAVKKEGIDVDFLIMSGVGTIQTVVQIMKMGATDYISKPFYLNELLIKIKKILEHRKLKKERIDLDSLVEVLKDTKNLFLYLDISELLNNLLFYLNKLFLPTEINIWLIDEKNELRLARFTGRLFRSDSGALSSLKILANKLIEKEIPVYINLERDIPPEEEYKFLNSFCKYKTSIIASPILGNSKKSIGAIILLRVEKEPYTSKDFNLFNVFVSQIAPQIENCILYTRLKDLNQEIMRSLAKAVEAKDVYTKGHSEKVALYAVKLGNKLKLKKEDLDILYWAGILHDVGKIGIPDSILNKPGKLTPQEFEVMKTHPVKGFEILSPITSIKEILPLIYHHHEKLDGTGYPEGLKGDQIPLLVRILSVVDAFDAMTSDRAYRKALEWSKVKDILKEGSGNHWDPDLVDIWIKTVEEENLLENKKGEEGER